MVYLLMNNVYRGSIYHIAKHIFHQVPQKIQLKTRVEYYT